MPTKAELIQQLLRSTTITRGRILAIRGTTAEVATKLGTINATIPAGVRLAPGDTVRIQDRVVRGRIRAREDLPVYDL